MRMMMFYRLQFEGMISLFISSFIYEFSVS